MTFTGIVAFLSYFIYINSEEFKKIRIPQTKHSSKKGRVFDFLKGHQSQQDKRFFYDLWYR